MIQHGEYCLQRPIRCPARRAGGVRSGHGGIYGRDRSDKPSTRIDIDYKQERAVANNHALHRRISSHEQLDQKNKTDPYDLHYVPISGSVNVDLESDIIKPIMIDLGRHHIGETLVDVIHIVRQQKVDDASAPRCTPNARIDS